MNDHRPYHPDWKSGRVLKPLPARAAWLQQPSETDDDYYARREASLIAWYAARGRSVPVLSIDLACGVGQYDGNGNPCGSGWW